MPSLPRVTVVNDNDDFLELIRDALHERFDVTTFNGTDISPAALVASGPNLLMIDLVMRGRQLSGWDLIQLCRNDERLAKVPIIVCSADPEQLRARAADLAAFSAMTVLRKPFSLTELDAAVDAALDSGTDSDEAGRAAG